MGFALVLAAAWADTITLDTGGVVEGELAHYEHGGDCRVSVDDGPLQGAIVIVPCYRVVSFVRTSRGPPPAVGAPAAATSPPSEPPPASVPVPTAAPLPPPDREERVGSTAVIAY